jgi:steroid 5-alpha reductase family enzyme
MNLWLSWLSALPFIGVLALLAWVLCTARRNVGLVDIFWPLFLLGAAVVWLIRLPAWHARAVLVLALVTLWALRLALHLGVRNWNAPEDYRYQAIRKRNEPGFVWKSLYLVFGLQAVLAFVISAPLHAAITASTPLGVLDITGAVIALGGILFEAVADAQLTLHRARRRERGQVMDWGLWRYSRHPNYFGEFCVWWGLFLVALSTDAWWSLVSPVLMTVLLLRVSGVALLEQDLARRPGYAAYAARTNAFFPGPRKSP